MAEKNSPSVTHVGYDIAPLSTFKFKIFNHSPDDLYFKF